MESDLVLTAPQRLVRSFAASLVLTALEPPLNVPRFQLLQVRHERRQHDPPHAWLRAPLAEEAQAV